MAADCWQRAVAYNLSLSAYGVLLELVSGGGRERRLHEGEKKQGWVVLLARVCPLKFDIGLIGQPQPLHLPPSPQSHRVFAG